MPRTRAKARAFTLVELLVVVAIIALLLSILLPALNQARELAQQVKCAAMMRQFAVASLGYGSDARGALPTTPQMFALATDKLRYHNQVKYHVLAYPKILADYDYMPVRDPRDVICPIFRRLKDNIDDSGWDVDSNYWGTYVTRSYSLTTVWALPDGTVPNSSSSHLAPFAMYRTAQVKRPSDLPMMSERFSLQSGIGPLQQPGMDVHPGGSYHQIRYYATQWGGSGPHFEDANWLFYDTSVRQQDFLKDIFISPDSPQHWSFLE